MKENDKKEENEEQKEREDNIEFLRYLREVEKFPLEMESLETSIESNRSTVRLADETIGHFSKTRTDNKWTLWATLGVSLLTLSILVVQTFSASKTKLESPIQLDSIQAEMYLKHQEQNNNDLSTQLDSLKLELRNLTNTLNSTIQNIDINEKSDTTANK